MTAFGLPPEKELFGKREVHFRCDLHVGFVSRNQIDLFAQIHHERAVVRCGFSFALLVRFQNQRVGKALRSLPAEVQGAIGNGRDLL